MSSENAIRELRDAIYLSFSDKDPIEKMRRTEESMISDELVELGALAPYEEARGAVERAEAALDTRAINATRSGLDEARENYLEKTGRDADKDEERKAELLEAKEQLEKEAARSERRAKKCHQICTPSDGTGSYVEGDLASWLMGCNGFGLRLLSGYEGDTPEEPLRNHLGEMAMARYGNKPGFLTPIRANDTTRLNQLVNRGGEETVRKLFITESIHRLDDDEGGFSGVAGHRVFGEDGTSNRERAIDYVKTTTAISEDGRSELLAELELYLAIEKWADMRAETYADEALEYSRRELRAFDRKKHEKLVERFRELLMLLCFKAMLPVYIEKNSNPLYYLGVWRDREWFQRVIGWMCECYDERHGGDDTWLASQYTRELDEDFENLRILDGVDGPDRSSLSVPEAFGELYFGGEDIDASNPRLMDGVFPDLRTFIPKGNKDEIREKEIENALRTACRSLKPWEGKVPSRTAALSILIWNTVIPAVMDDPSMTKGFVIQRARPLLTSINEVKKTGGSPGVDDEELVLDGGSLTVVCVRRTEPVDVLGIDGLAGRRLAMVSKPLRTFSLDPLRWRTVVFGTQISGIAAKMRGEDPRVIDTSDLNYSLSGPGEGHAKRQVFDSKVHAAIVSKVGEDGRTHLYLLDMGSRAGTIVRRGSDRYIISPGTWMPVRKGDDGLITYAEGVDEAARGIWKKTSVPNDEMRRECAERGGGFYRELIEPEGFKKAYGEIEGEAAPLPFELKRGDTIVLGVNGDREKTPAYKIV